jgi:hypothetical protein
MWRPRAAQRSPDVSRSRKTKGKQRTPPASRQAARYAAPPRGPLTSESLLVNPQLAISKSLLFGQITVQPNVSLDHFLDTEHLAHAPLSGLAEG